MRGSRLAPALLLMVLAAAGCRHAFPVAPLPPDWVDLIGSAPGLQALYRMDCCGHHNLITTVRWGGDVLALTVAVPPGGVALEYWSTREGAALTENRGRCYYPLPSGFLPLPSGRSLPVPASALSALLAGRVSASAAPVAARPGWVEWSDEGAWIRARIAGSPARIVEAEVGRLGSPEADVEMRVLEHQGRLPSRSTIVAERERISLHLQSWRTGDPPPAPAWLSAPRCEDVP